MEISDSTQIIINISYLVALIGLIWKIATLHTKMKSDIEQNKESLKNSCKSNKETYERLERKVDRVDNINLELQIDVAKIQTSIVGIEKGIIEIKDMIKQRVV